MPLIIRRDPTDVIFKGIDPLKFYKYAIMHMELGYLIIVSIWRLRRGKSSLEHQEFQELQQW